MAKSRVSITVWKTWKGSRHYTPSHTPSRTVFHVLVFCTGYFIKEIKNIFARVPIRCRNTRGSLGELEIAWKHSWKFGRTRNCVETLATSISRSPKLSTRVFITVETRKMFFVEFKKTTENLSVIFV